MINGELGFWQSQYRQQHPARYAPTARAEDRVPEDGVDVAIIGAGFTGLWTALTIKELSPRTEVIVLDAHEVGYGASGRNGGWVSPLLPGNRRRLAEVDGLESLRRMQRVFIDATSQIGTLLESLDIDAHSATAGIVTAATTPAGVSRAKAKREADLHYGFHPDEVEVLGAAELRSAVDIAPALGGLRCHIGMAVDPARMVHGLARAAAAAGVAVYEHTPVTEIHAAERTFDVETDSVPRNIQADRILVCTEGYTGALTGSRSLVPINSSMITTSALSAEDWARIGWEDRFCLNDTAHAFIYAQRTADGRIAIGGRGSPYRFGSGTGGEGTVDPATIAALTRRLHTFFPELDFTVDHAWSGVLGVTRDWNGGVHFNPRTGIGASLGYAGHGVTSAFVGGRTLAHLALGIESPLTSLPWVGYSAQQWEPEPLRWAGIHSMYRLFGIADYYEELSHARTTSRLATIASRIAGLRE